MKGYLHGKGKFTKTAYSKRFLMDIFTNGTLLDGMDYIRLKSCHPRCVHFSVYSHIPQKHDAVTQTPGSFEKTIKAIGKRRMFTISGKSLTPCAPCAALRLSSFAWGYA